MRPRPPDPLPSRRDLFSKSWGVIAAFFMPAAAAAAGTAIGGQSVSRQIDRATEEVRGLASIVDADRPRLGAISRIVGGKGRVLLVPGTSHLYGSPTLTAASLGYPHDRNALSPFFELRGDNPVWVFEEDFPVRATPADTVITTGSPLSGAIARAVIPIWDREGRRPVLVSDSRPDVPVETLPYHFVTTEDIEVTVVSGMEGGRTAVKRGKGLLRAKTGALTHLDDPGWLTKDIVLVTRVPLTRDGPDVVILSGGHGPGTQAVELLFESGVGLSLLQALASRLEDWRYFQFVLEVAEIEHDAAMSRAHSVALSEAAPPMRVEVLGT